MRFSRKDSRLGRYSRFTVHAVLHLGAAIASIAAMAFSCTPAFAGLECNPRARYQPLEWRSTGTQQTLRGLDIHWSNESGWVHRTLVEGVAGRSTILTQTFDYRQAILANTWEDSESGWSARLEYHIQVEGDNLGERRERLRSGSSYSRIRLAFSSGYDTSLDLPGQIRDENRVLGLLIATLEERDELHQVAGQIPASQIDQILFLEANIDNQAYPEKDELLYQFDGFLTRYVVEALGAIVREALDDSSLPSVEQLSVWTLITGKARLSATIAEPALVDLVAGFRSLENVDPLSDLSLEKFSEEPCGERQ